MAAKIVIGWGDYVPSATVTTGSQEPTLPASLLKDGRLGLYWSALAGDDATHILIDNGAAVTFGAVALGNCNLTAAGTRRVRCSNSDATGQLGEIHDSGTAVAGVHPSFRLMVYVLPVNVTARYVRINLVQGAGQTLTVGKAWLLRLFRPTINHAFGWEPLVRDLSERSYNQAGGLYELPREKTRGVRITLPMVTSAEWKSSMEAIQRSSGITEDVMICRDHESDNVGRDTIIGPPEQPIAGSQLHYNIWPHSFEVYERK